MQPSAWRSSCCSGWLISAESLECEKYFTPTEKIACSSLNQSNASKPNFNVSFNMWVWVKSWLEVQKGKANQRVFCLGFFWAAFGLLGKKKKKRIKCVKFPVEPSVPHVGEQSHLNFSKQIPAVGRPDMEGQKQKQNREMISWQWKHKLHYFQRESLQGVQVSEASRTSRDLQTFPLFVYLSRRRKVSDIVGLQLALLWKLPCRREARSLW